MSLKPTYDQVPHVIRKHPLMTNDAESVFISLYKILKDKEYCIYSNEKLCKASRVGLTTLNKSIDLLINILAITKNGLRQNRRFKKGLLLMADLGKDTYSLNNDVVNNNTALQLNTSPFNDHASSFGGDASSFGGDILRTNIKNLTTKTSSVIFFSNETDKKIITIFHESKKEIPYLETDGKLLSYIKWSVDEGIKEGVDEEGRLKSLINFLRDGTLKVSKKWIGMQSNNKAISKNSYNSEYQEYVSKENSKIQLGLLPTGSKILSISQWSSNFGVKL